MNLFAEQKLTHRLKNLWLTKEICCTGKDGLGVWDGNIVKLGCYDGCTVINIIKFIEFFLEKKEVLPYVMTWMNLEDIMVNEISQLQVDKYYMIPLTLGI